MGKNTPPPEDSNKGQGKQGDKQEGQTDKDFYGKQAQEVTKEGNGGNST